MLLNYLKVAWRNLFRNKLHTGINILGLIIGFTIGIADLLVTNQQFRWDHEHVKRDRLFEVYTIYHDPKGDRYENAFAAGPGLAYAAAAPGVEAMTRIGDAGNHIEYKGRDISMVVTTVDADFLRMFTVPVVRGRGADALRDLTDAVITERTAKTIFGNEDPIGKHFRATMGDRQQDLVVSSVVKDPAGSSVRFSILARIENESGYAQRRNEWDNTSMSMYILLKEGVSRRQAELQLKEIDQQHVPDRSRDLKEKGAKPDSYGDLWATRLLPMTEVNFNTDVNGHRAKSVGEVMIEFSLGLVIILIGCFNFVNISLAGAFTRSREVGVRKCLGADKWRLFVQLWGESLLICVVAFGLSLILVNVLLENIAVLQYNRELLKRLMWQPGFFALMGGLLLFVSLMAGGYPSLVMIRFKVVETLKGNVKMNRRSPLRNGLIVFQFVISCIMISCTYIFYRQYEYLLGADVGIAKESLISVPLHDPAKGHEMVEKLRLRLAADPRIVSVSGSNINLGRGFDHRTVHIGTNFTYKGKDMNTLRAMVDYDYLKTIGVRLEAGRDFDPSFGEDTVDNVVISEGMAKQLQEKNIVGKTIMTDSSTGRGWHIVGVFPDYHLYTVAEAVQPLTLTVNMKDEIPYCFIRTTGKDMFGAMAAIKREMAVLEPGQDFNGSFVDDNVNDWYNDERGASEIFGVCALIAIVLSCSGLLAMVLLVVAQRVKEIGVRKVLGASVGSISLLVSREFAKLVGLAVLIATPVAWFFMNKWLQRYPYRVSVTIWNFLLVGAVALGIAMVTIAFNTIRAARENPVKALRSE